MERERFVRGFKAEAERTALELRSELRIGVSGKLEPLRLAEHLQVPVLSIEDIRYANRAALEHFLHGRGREEFSAAALHVGRYRRIILVNPAHSDARQASNLCHELAHVILGHDSEGPVGDDGTRNWDHRQEDEADWMGGCLLIPAQAAEASARRGEDDAMVASRFGVSLSMATMRMNTTGARRIAERAHRRRSVTLSSSIAPTRKSRR